MFNFNSPRFESIQTVSAEVKGHANLVSAAMQVRTVMVSSTTVNPGSDKTERSAIARQVTALSWREPLQVKHNTNPHEKGSQISYYLIG